MKTTLAVIAMVTLAATAGAQVIVHEQQSKASTEQHLQLTWETAPSTGVHLSVATATVTGAPYTAEAVTETVQILADGNRIVRRTTARVYRDGQGRTRRETLGSDGQATSVLISDPAGGKSVMFDPASNTARRSGVATFVTTAGGRAEGTAITTTATSVAGTGGTAYYVTTESKLQAEQKVAQQAELKAHVVAGERATVTTVGPVTWVTEHTSTEAAAPSKEDLGQQVIEGVTAKGTRTTTVIPAGAIGNEQPITVTSEEWTSPDLKALVMTKHVDPRAGETTYRLTGITRGEPSPSLFELPAGVTVK